MTDAFQKGEEAMKQGCYQLASDAFYELLQMELEGQSNLKFLAEIIINLANVEKQLGRYEESQKLIELINPYDLSDDLLLRFETLHATISLDRNTFGEAYQVLTALLSHIPFFQWPAETQTLFMGLEYRLNKHYLTLQNEAKRLSEGGLFLEAASHYLQILEGIEKRKYPAAQRKQNKGRITSTIYYQLAEAYFNHGDNDRAIEILLQKIDEWKKLPPDQIIDENKKHLFLLALAYRAKGDFEFASDTLRNYLSLGDEQRLPFYAEAKWELGIACYALGHTEEAKEHWQALIETSTRSSIIKLARVYLARLALSQDEQERVEELLSPLVTTLLPDDPLHYEISYLRAEANYHLQNYTAAACLFEQSLLNHHQKLSEWHARALYNLGWSYLKIVEDPLHNRSNQDEYLTRAENTFRKLISVIHLPLESCKSPLFFKAPSPQVTASPTDTLKEKAILGLARAYLLRYFYLNDEQSVQEIELLLSPPMQFYSLENKAESLLIRAEAAATYEKKAELYQTLTNTLCYRGTSSFPTGWYYRGINEYQEGGKLYETDNQAAEALFSKAIESFQNAYDLLYDTNKLLAGQSLKHLSQAYYYIRTPESLLNAFSMLNTLINQEKEIFNTLEEKDEVLYGLGLTASELFQLDYEDKYIEISENALNTVVLDFPDSSFAPDALFTLANLYYQNQCYENALPIFVQLAVKYPSSYYASEAWFWAGHCSEETESDEEEARHFRRQVYELYPESPKAGEAFFRTYSFAEYLHGDETAYNHLRSMLKLFPDDPFIVVAKYLIGLDQKEDRKTLQGQLLHPKSLTSALQSLEEARDTFDLLNSKQMIPEEHYDYLITIRYRAILEHSIVSLALAEESSEGTRKEAQAVRNKSFWPFGFVKAPGFVDRKSINIKSIWIDLRSTNPGSFHASPKGKNFCYRLLDTAINNLENVLKDFSDPDHPLTSRLLEVDDYPRIFEESQFALAQVYLAAFTMSSKEATRREDADIEDREEGIAPAITEERSLKDALGSQSIPDKTEKNGKEKAREIFHEMLKHYDSLEMTTGYYLSRVLYELALLAIQEGDYNAALKKLEQAERAGKNGTLTIEQKLDIWIQKSHCYRSLKQMNMAMLMLSYVINENATSSLRIKAMLLRADLYALQGRHELAIKQLEAASRKGGEWAQEAKEKLRKEYGLD